MIFFTVPCDFKVSTLNKLMALNHTYTNARVAETYGQITVKNPIGSGRAGDLLPQADIQMLADYIAQSNERGLKFNYTLNPTCLGNMEFSKDGLKIITDFIYTLYVAGVRSFTIAMPSLMELVRSLRLNVEIKASTVCQITNANKASAYKALGADRMVLDESINRNFGTLKRIYKVCNAIELIVNVICHQNCIYEIFHHNQTSHDSSGTQQSYQYYSHRCMMKRCESPANLLRMAWIRPEDLKYYIAIGIHYFKIQGRQAALKGDIVKTVQCYMEQSFEGNLMELLDAFSPTNSFQVFIDNKKLDGYLKPFAEQDQFCHSDCSACHYCDQFLTRNFIVRDITEMNQKASLFYKNYDAFLRNCRQLSEEEKQSRSKYV